MNKKICSILMAVLLIFSTPLFSYTSLAASTTVRYISNPDSYYELSVPAVMAPGDYATITVTGRWDSSKQISVTSDESVTLANDTDDEEITLSIYFEGILEAGSGSSEVSTSKELHIEDIGDVPFGTWEGTFEYAVDFLEEHSGIIPEGGIYYVSATQSEGEGNVGDYSIAEAIYEAGDKFPDEPQNGDVYLYGDYEYRYQCGFEGSWFNDYTAFEWGVTVKDSSKTSYSPMLSSINGKDVNNLAGAYWCCVNMEKSPKLPKTAKSISLAFYYCSALKEPPVIPENVTSVCRTFDNCIRLTEAPSLPLSVENIDQAFLDCISLVNSPVIHENITRMEEAFCGCTSLSGAIEINATNLSVYVNALSGTNITEITGSISDELKAEILATK